MSFPPTFEQARTLVATGPAPMDPNQRRERLGTYLQSAGTLLASGAIAGLTYSGYMLYDLGVPLTGGLLFMTVFWPILHTPETLVRFTPPEKRVWIERMVSNLIHASRHGLKPEQRHYVQLSIEQAADAIGTMAGTEPWMIYSPKPGQPSVGTPQTVTSRGTRLAKSAEQLVHLSRKRAAGHEDFLSSYRNSAYDIVELIHDFGLDPVNLVDPERRLVGQIVQDQQIRLPDSTAAVKRLLTEWKQGPAEDGAPAIELAKIEVEFNRLVSTWATARAMADEDRMDDIDAELNKGCRALAGKLTEAIADRSRRLHDDLRVETRFLESKYLEPDEGDLAA